MEKEKKEREEKKQTKKDQKQWEEDRAKEGETSAMLRKVRDGESSILKEVKEMQDQENQ